MPTSDPKSIFDSAIRIQGHTERAQFVEQACCHDAEFRREVNELLAAHDQAGDFMAQPPFVDEATLGHRAVDAAHTRDSRPPQFIADYEILDEIARGGMGVVYRARQQNLKRTVALKMILSGNLANEQEVKRFHSEAEAAAHLDHPGIVPIYEVGEHEGQHYFSMGYVDGGSLVDKIKDGPLPPGKAAAYVHKIARAIAYAHDRGVVHRDLKPGNVLIDKNDEPRITDFGLAKRVEHDSNLTATGQILGTPSYMAPEQAQGKKVGPRADVYSLGALLYVLVAGRPPFQAASTLDTLKQVLENEPVSPRRLNAAVPRDLETICLKSLEKEASRRYQTASEFAEELDRFLNHDPILARPLDRVARTWRFCKKRPALAALVVAVLMLAVGGPLLAIQLARTARSERLAKEQQIKTNMKLQVTLALNALGEKERTRVQRMRSTLDNMIPRIIDARSSLEVDEKVVVELLSDAIGFYEAHISFYQDEWGARKSVENSRRKLRQFRESLSQLEHATPGQIP